MKINLHKKKFRSRTNSSKGEVTADTYFYYFQEDDMIWAHYNGGNILKGFLIGTQKQDGSFHFSYQHLNRKKKVISGTCISTPRINPQGNIILDEAWQWSDGSQTKGTSSLVEIIPEPQSEETK
ncbi:n-acetylglutamate synthase [Flavobacteriaceae bacterium F08102]|nr:n-acetylglutamate synthase [Flavobacteriaceae bacterium F08102]